MKDNTKDQILKIAAELFAKKGFSKTSVREICKEAGVNVASINYHFGNKENLYVKVLTYWKDIAFEKYPLDICFDESIEPEKRLKHFIVCQLFHTLYVEESPWFGALFSRESLEPTKALMEVTQESIGPGIEVLQQIVSKLVNERTGADIRFIAASILGQCTFYQYTPKEIIQKYFNYGECNEKNILTLAEYIYEFSLHAIHGYNRKTAGVR